MSELILPPDACIDVPDVRDYDHTETFWAGIELPRRVINKNTYVQNQALSNDPSTIYACTCFQLSHVINEMNYIEAQKASDMSIYTDTKGYDFWVKALKLGAHLNLGWSLQWAAKLALNEGYVSGYTLARGLLAVKQALAMGQMISTGSKRIDWGATRRNGNVVVEWEAYWHAFGLLGYDDDLYGGVLIHKNSYGDLAYDHGYFYTKYADIGLLYSTIAYVDNDNTQTIKAIQAKKRRDEAIQKGYMNGQRMTELATRIESMYMARNVSGMKVPEDQLWNKKNPNTAVLRQEARWMLEKATKRVILFDIGNPSGTITRGELAEWCVRI